MTNTHKTVVEIIESLKGEGFIYEFCIKDNQLYCIPIDRKYEPGELIIEKSEFHAPEIDAKGIHSGSTTVFAISAEDGAKGILIDAYGLYSGPEKAGLLSKIPIMPVKTLKAV